MMHKVTLAVIGLIVMGLLTGATAQEGGKRVVSMPEFEGFGPFSPAIRVGKTIYLSGQIPIDVKTKQVSANASIEEQTRQVLENIKAVLAADALTMDHIVTTTVFLKDMNEIGKMNGVYAAFFKSAPPARTTVEVARLPRDVKIEISAIAVAP